MAQSFIREVERRQLDKDKYDFKILHKNCIRYVSRGKTNNWENGVWVKNKKGKGGIRYKRVKKG